MNLFSFYYEALKTKSKRVITIKARDHRKHNKKLTNTPFEKEIIKKLPKDYLLGYGSKENETFTNNNSNADFGRDIIDICIIYPKKIVRDNIKKIEELALLQDLC